MMDIVFPKTNEEKFIEIAKKLGYNSLCFVYPLKDFKSGKYNFDVKHGIICNENEIQKAKKIAKFVFVKASENSRRVIESNKNIIVFGFEDSPGKDFLHQKRSGLNHITCFLAAKNNIIIGFSFNSLLNASGKQRETLFGRMYSNIRLCKKYKTQTMFGSFATNPYEMRNYKDFAVLFET